MRTLVAYGNGLMTRCAFDPDTARMSRMRIERYRAEGSFGLVPDGGLLRDLGYDYDLAGHIVGIRDRSPGCGVPGTPLGPDAIDLEYEHDALYRLVRATGREHDSRSPSDQPWLDAELFTDQDATRTRTYARRYAYDDAGNVLEMRHATGGGVGSFTQTFAVAADSNRVESFTQGGMTSSHTYDANGNTLVQAGVRHFHWNHTDQLHGFRIQAGNGPPSIEAVYLYDAAGERVKKVVRRQGGAVASTAYVGHLFERHKSGGRELDTIHVSDDQMRVAELQVGNPAAGDLGSRLRFHLGDHLGSSAFTVDGDGNSVLREEYYPFGGTSFGSAAKKRYRFIGRERDEESSCATTAHASTRRGSCVGSARILRA